MTLSNWSPRRIGLLAAAMILAPAAGQAASLLGDQINLNRLIPSTGFDHCDTSTGTTPCTTTVVAGAADVVSLSGGNNLSVNPEADSIAMFFGPDGGRGGGIADHHIIISDLDFGSGITGISWTTDLPGFDPAMLSFTASSVSFYSGQIRWTGGQSLVINLQTADVPVPAAAGLLVGALGVMGLAGRRRQRNAG